MGRNKCVLFGAVMLAIGVMCGYVLPGRLGPVWKSIVARDAVKLRAPMAALSAGHYAEARHELAPLAASGNATAQRLLGEIYRRGLGAPRNNGLAFKWFQKAAAQNDARAQYELAGMYAYGAGVKRDNAKADEWFHRAVANGYPTHSPAVRKGATAGS